LFFGDIQKFNGTLFGAMSGDHIFNWPISERSLPNMEVFQIQDVSAHGQKHPVYFCLF